MGTKSGRSHKTRKMKIIALVAWINDLFSGVLEMRYWCAIDEVMFQEHYSITT